METSEEKRLSMVVLAGGASSRMGTDKSDLFLNGQTFLEIQIRKGIALGITHILVSGYRGTAALPYLNALDTAEEERITLDLSVVKDRIQGKGPLGGLESCLRKAKYPRVLVLGVDVPMVQVGDLELLIQKALASSAKAVILQHGEKQEPLIGVYHADLADAMMEEIISHKGSAFAFLRRIGYEVYESRSPEQYFANINDPTAYQALFA